ncbi:MAG TPA: zf-HC2 domain-containing protein [Myxococcaceae bacterium]|nr:zf-HC2 domain-containing protein [Myxococcaceae bacterium]
MARHEEEALWALATGELEAEARARVEAHLAHCPACAQRLVEVRETQSLLRSARGMEPQVRWAEVDDRILSAATRRFARLERQPRWPWVLAAVGACAVAVLALMP